MSFIRIALALCFSACLFAACSSDDGPSGGPVTGAADTHCTEADGGTIVQATSQADCNATGGDTNNPSDYGDTMFNAEGDDDDCKYHVKWSASAVRENSNVTFTVIATNKSDGSATHNANVIPEVFLNSTHPAPNTNYTTVENPTGTYAIGPLQFDAPGQWTVRFHLFEQCADELDDSPHGHAAFFVSVP
jgi:hypothetical protein